MSGNHRAKLVLLDKRRQTTEKREGENVASSETRPEPLRRVKKRILIPAIVLAMMLGLCGWLYVRGTWADAAERNPAGADAGAVTQLLREPDGNVSIRCAMVVDAAPKDVWAVVIDYWRHHEFLPYVSDVKGTKQPDGRFLVEGVAHSRLWGDWPFQSIVTHTEAPDADRFSTSWNERDQEVFSVGFSISRGGWTLTPYDKAHKQTLLVFMLQIELKDYPNFIVRNVLMDRLHSVVKAMRDEALKRRPA